MQTSIRRQFLVAAISIPIVTSLVTGLNALDGWEPREEMLRIYEFVAPLLVIVWLGSDPALPVEHRPSFDHYLLIWILFPFLALYHQFVSHRWKGVARVLGFFFLIFAPYVTWSILYVAS